jgi:protoporphyrinogen oxidase
MKKKIAVIGAGISGITITRILEEKFDVSVYERNAHIGGLVHCDRKEDFLYHRVGGHVFNSKNKEILDWFWANFDKEKEFIQANRNAKILFNNQLIGYPIENYLYQMDSSVVKQVMNELLNINRTEYKDPLTYPDFEAFLKGNFGITLYELYFKPYNQKIWKTDLSTVSMHWLEGKLPMPRLLDIITSNITKEDEKQMVHSTFYYPIKGGSQFVADRLAKNLKIHYNSLLDSIDINRGFIKLFGEEFDKLVYTGDIRKLPDMLKGSTKEFLFNNEIRSLRSNATSSVLCECDANDLSWLYIPEPHYKAHRIIYTGNFSPSNNSQTSNRSSCTVEFSGICTHEEMKEELNHLPGNLRLIDYNQEVNSYVIQDNRTRTLIKSYKEFLASFGIYLLGRFGEWEYYNMDKAMEAAFALKKQLSS